MSLVEGLVIIVLILAITMTIWLIIQRISYDGKIVFEKDPESGKLTYTLELDIDPREIQNMKDVSFKVVGKEEIAD
jgi:hypothetical protein